MIIPRVTVALLAAASASAATLAPHRVAFSSLSDSADDAQVLLLEGLTQDGLVSITGIPGFAKTKRTLMSNLHACISDVDASDADGVQTQAFPDGTVRRSFASSTNHAAGAKPIKALEEYYALASHDSSACAAFASALDGFRASVDRAFGSFASRLSNEMGDSLPAPLLSTPGDYDSAGRVDYDDIESVVEGGNHLEHFHSYQKLSGVGEEATIEFHADQGFFIAFTPGLVVSADASDESAALSDGFYVKDASGEEMEVEFDDEDDLVFMMGDGVNQL